MKKTMTIGMLMLLMVGCTEQLCDLSETSSVINQTMGVDATDDVPEDISCIDELIGRYPDDFHNVLIYESMDELEEEIENLIDMPYYELRDWTIEHNFTNSVLESNIVYDSLLTVYMERYGETEEDADYPNDECIDLFAEELRTEYPHLFPNYNDESQLEPFDISINALFNSNGLLILGEDVYISVNDWEGVVSLLYTDYPKVRELPRYTYAFESIGNLNGGLGYKPKPEILLSNTITNGKYKLKYKYSVKYSQHRFYGTSDIVVSLLVKNYKKNCIIKRRISLDTEFSVWFIPSSIEQTGNTENYHFGPWETAKRVYKYNYQRHYYYATIVPYYGSRITVHSLRVSNEEVFVDL